MTSTIMSNRLENALFGGWHGVGARSLGLVLVTLGTSIGLLWSGNLELTIVAVAIGLFLVRLVGQRFVSPARLAPTPVEIEQVKEMFSLVDEYASRAAELVSITVTQKLGHVARPTSDSLLPKIRNFVERRVLGRGDRRRTPRLPRGICHCGCGEKTTLHLATNVAKGEFKGTPCKFVHGHNLRPVDHEGLARSAIDRRKNKEKVTSA